MGRRSSPWARLPWSACRCSRRRLSKRCCASTWTWSGRPAGYQAALDEFAADTPLRVLLENQVLEETTHVELERILAGPSAVRSGAPVVRAPRRVAPGPRGSRVALRGRSLRPLQG